MLSRLRAFIRRQLTVDVPAEMHLCLECGRIECTASEFKTCARRKTRAAELTAGLAPPQSASATHTKNDAAKKQARRAISKKWARAKMASS
jgi:hypothetical protein